MKPAMKPAPAPLTVIGGFLGAGKTTLVNHLLREASGIRYAVLVNDFGDLAIDEDLIASHDGQTIALANGCICCTIGDDLVETIMTLMSGPDRPEQLVIEASGVADPGAIADIGSLDPNLVRDLTLVVVDAEQVRSQWADALLQDTVARQLRAADLLVLNKISALAAEEAASLQQWLGEKCPDVPVFCSADGSLPAEVLSRLTPRSDKETSDAHLHAEHAGADHGALFTSYTTEVPGDQTKADFIAMLKALGASTLRVKGHARLDGVPYEVQKVGPRLKLRQINEDAAPKRFMLVHISVALQRDKP